MATSNMRLLQKVDDLLWWQNFGEVVLGCVEPQSPTGSIPGILFSPGSQLVGHFLAIGHT